MPDWRHPAKCQHLCQGAPAAGPSAAPTWPEPSGRREGWAQLLLGFAPKGSVVLRKMPGAGVASRDVFDLEGWSHSDFRGEKAAAPPGEVAGR